jgi:hypothetical protein
MPSATMMTAQKMLASLGYPGERDWTLTLADPNALHRAIPAGLIGVYLMISMRRLIYTGRSDICLQTRLVAHEHLPSAGLVAWRVCTSALMAWRLERLWYARIVGQPGVLNRIFPAAPDAAAALRFYSQSATRRRSG